MSVAQIVTCCRRNVTGVVSVGVLFANAANVQANKVTGEIANDSEFEDRAWSHVLKREE